MAKKKKDKTEYEDFELDLPIETWRKLKVEAKKNHCSVDKFVASVLKIFIDKEKTKNSLKENT
jgi:hypothetical protein